ncbi:MAG: serine endoprotease [Gemmataceae bacterium]|nr:serine endoprotease [Gemmataceae bacterium]
MRWRSAPALACGLLAAATAAAADTKPGPNPDPKPAVGKPDRFEVPYRLTDTKHVLVRVKINGKGPFNLILDTGAPAVFITKAVAKKAKAETDEKGWANLDRFELEGGVVVDKPRARVEDLFQLEGMNGMGLAGVELHGVVGYNVLAKYRVQYDFTADKLAFEPIPGFDPPALVPLGGGKGQGGLDAIGPLMKMMASLMGIKPNFQTIPRGFVGIEFDDADGVVVRKVLSGSPGEKAGIKAGDKIEAVKNVGVDDARDLARALVKAGVGVKLKVTVRRGEKTEDLTVELGRGL